MQNMPQVNEVIIYSEKRAGADKTEKELFIRSIDNGKVFGYDAQGQQHLLSISNLNMRMTGETFGSVEEFVASRLDNNDQEDLIIVTPGRASNAKIDSDVAISAIKSKTHNKRLSLCIHNTLNNFFKVGDRCEIGISRDFNRIYLRHSNNGYQISTNGNGGNGKIQFPDPSNECSIWNYLNNLPGRRASMNWKYSAKRKSYYITIKED